MYQVLLAGKDSALRYILKRFDWETYNFAVAAEAKNGREVMEALSSRKIDLALVDVCISRAGCMKLLKQMRSSRPSVRIILLSGYSDFEYAQHSMRCDLFDYLAKPVSPHELSAALRHAADYFESLSAKPPARSLCKEAMDSLPEYFSAENNPSSIVLGVCSFVTKNIEGDVSLEAAAGALQLSRDYAGRIFKKKTGMNFSEYVTRVKMERAKKLLATARYKNYEISEKLGYKTPDYFTRLFKKYVGKTPLAYRLSIHADRASDKNKDT